MLVSNKVSLTAVAMFTAFVSISSVKADEAKPVGLPVGQPPVGHPVMGKPVPPRPVGLPIGKVVPGTGHGGPTMGMPPRLGLPVGKVVPGTGHGGPTMGMPRPPGMPPVVGLPRPRPPVVGLPLPPRPPTTGIVVPHPPLGMPFPIGIVAPVKPNYTLECDSVRGNVSGIHRVKLHIQTGHRVYEVNGAVKYFDGSRSNIDTTATGFIQRGKIDLNLRNVGTIELTGSAPGLAAVEPIYKGDVFLYGHNDQFGLRCRLEKN